MGRDDGAVVVAGVGLSKFAPERPDGTPVDWIVEATQAALDDYLALECYVGITGWICDERRGLALRESAKTIPDDRLLVETDAPYLLPRTAPKVDHRRNEPMYLLYVVRALAEARGQAEDRVAQITARNAEAFFRLDVSSRAQRGIA